MMIDDIDIDNVIAQFPGGGANAIRKPRRSERYRQPGYVVARIAKERPCNEPYPFRFITVANSAIRITR